MRDRLSHLQTEQTDSDGFSTVELDTLTEQEAAAAAAPKGRVATLAAAGAAEPSLDQDQDLDGILKEAERLRLEIQQIQNDVKELKDVNYQALNQTSHSAAELCPAAKRDSNAIGADVKRRGEAVLQRLHMMDRLRGELEARRGNADPAVRIAGTQYRCLGGALREAMFAYNDAETSHRDACRRQIRRQMEVVGREVSEQELQDMMEGEELCVFSAQLTGKTARSALLQIESRHQELRELERRMAGIQDLFLDVAVLVEEQDAALNSIQKNVQDVNVTTQDTVATLERAKAADRNNPFKKMFCGCFPCYYN
ncbi:syntaxin-11-like [Cololabis saira]|uniref:syntaxin-11-like n=1 Tax=Cololabis saira TaxID=129043 RepID=UPI002AD3E979|nr:syntaxin-11-like [Cololabis saira]